MDRGGDVERDGNDEEPTTVRPRSLTPPPVVRSTTPAAGSGPLSLFDEEFLLAVEEASGFGPLPEPPSVASPLLPPPPGYAEAVPPAHSEPMRTWADADDGPDEGASHVSAETGSWDTSAEEVARTSRMPVEAASSEPTGASMETSPGMPVAPTEAVGATSPLEVAPAGATLPLEVAPAEAGRATSTEATAASGGTPSEGAATERVDEAAGTTADAAAPVRLPKRRTTRRLVAPTAVLGNPPVRRLVDPDSQPLPIALPSLEASANDEADEPTLEVDLETLVRQAKTPLARVPLRFLRGPRGVGMSPIEEALARTERELGLPAGSPTKGKPGHQTLRGAQSPLTAEQRALLAGVFDGLDDRPAGPATATADDEAWPDWPITPRQSDVRASAPPAPPAYVSPLEALPRTGAAPASVEPARVTAPRPATSSLTVVPPSPVPASAGETSGVDEGDVERATRRRNSVPRFVSALFHLGGPSEGEGLGSGVRPRKRRAGWVVGGVAAAALLLVGVFGMANRESSETGPSAVAAASIPVLPAPEPMPVAPPTVLPESPAPSVQPILEERPQPPAMVGASTEVDDEVTHAEASPVARKTTRPMRRRARPAPPPPPPEEEATAVVDDVPEPEPVVAAAPTIPVVERKTAASLFADATAAFDREDYESAFRLAMESRAMQRRGEPELLRLIARSGCRIGQRDHAREAVRALPLLKRSSVRRECRREGERLGW